VPGVTVDRQCGSSQQAVHFAAAGVIAGQYDVAVAGGVESMTRVPMLCTVTQGPGEPFGPRMLARYDGRLVPQGVSAEIVAERWGLDRGQLDEIAVRSHARAASARSSGAFDDELAPVGEFAADEGIRPESTRETLAGLRTAFREDGVVTAGNSSQISDGAAALLVTTSEVAARHGWRPLARLHAFATAGVDPVTMLTAPIPATARVLARAGLAIGDIDAFEVNEAFASVVLAWQKELDVDPARVNVNGGAIALGHPLGATGAVLITKALHELERTGGRYALISMCCGGGLGTGTLIERLG